MAGGRRRPVGVLATARCPLAADGRIQISERKETRREVTVADEGMVVAPTEEVVVAVPTVEQGGGAGVGGEGGGVVSEGGGVAALCDSATGVGEREGTTP